MTKTPARGHALKILTQDPDHRIEWHCSWEWIGTGRTWRTYNKVTVDRRWVERFAERHGLEVPVVHCEVCPPKGPLLYAKKWRCWRCGRTGEIP